MNRIDSQGVAFAIIHRRGVVAHSAMNLLAASRLEKPMEGLLGTWGGGLQGKAILRSRLGLQAPRPATGVSGALRAQSVLGVSPKSVPRVDPECAGHLFRVFLNPWFGNPWFAPWIPVVVVIFVVSVISANPALGSLFVAV